VLIREQLAVSYSCRFTGDLVLSLNAWSKLDYSVYLNMGGQQGKDVTNGSVKRKSGDKKKTTQNLKKGE